MRPTQDRNGEDWYTPKQQRARATVDALIEATIVELQLHGESGLRQERILANSGIAQGSLYHHFGNRDGLIDATYTVILQRSIDELLQQLESAVSTSVSAGSSDPVGDLVNALFDETTSRSRTNQLVVMAAAVNRPGLQPSVQREQDRLIDALGVLVARLQEIGALRADLAPRELAAFIHAVTFGHVALSLSDDSPDHDGWCDFVVRTISNTGPPAAERSIPDQADGEGELPLALST